MLVCTISKISHEYEIVSSNKLRCTVPLAGLLLVQKKKNIQMVEHVTTWLCWLNQERMPLPYSLDFTNKCEDKTQVSHSCQWRNIRVISCRHTHFFSSKPSFYFLFLIIFLWMQYYFLETSSFTHKHQKWCSSSSSKYFPVLYPGL